MEEGRGRREGERGINNEPEGTNQAVQDREGGIEADP
jgi:hypothetical protein